jgi:nitroreductase
MSHPKDAQLDHPIQPTLAERWSPCVFADRPVDTADLASLLEAARWAPSSYNEQPWRYLMARRSQGEPFERLLSCLVEPNQAWARHAAVLLVGVAMTRFARNDKPNPAAQHDLGLAAACLSAEATVRGLSVHQMIGILPDRVRELYALPDDAEPLTAIAIGHRGEPTPEQEAFAARDRIPRSRRSIAEFVFEGTWGESAKLE